MPGLFLALIVCAFAMLFGSVFEAAYLSATGFLFWWYLVWSIPIVLIALLVMLGFSAVGLGAGAVAGKGVGALLGLGAGGTIGFGLAFLIVVKRALSVMGAFMLSTAVYAAAEGYVWNKQRLILGTVMVGLPLIITMLTRSSSTTTVHEKKK